MSDIVEQMTNYRISQIELAEAKYYEDLIRALDKIEKEVMSYVGTLPLKEGKLFELKSAVASRPIIREILEREYLQWSDTVVREGYSKQAKRIERAFKSIGRIPIEFQQLTDSDLSVITNLKRQTFSQFKDVANTFTRTISDKIYQSTLVGTNFTELQTELRQTINGIYAIADDEAVNKLIKEIKKDEVRIRRLTGPQRVLIRTKLDKNIQTLQSKYATTRSGENMKRYAGQILNDGLREFDATLNLHKSVEAGLTMCKYFGNIIPTTRDHCRLVRSGEYDIRNGGLFTIDEVKELWASKSWKGKKSGDPLLVRGGYNCRHQWSFVNPDWYDESGTIITE
jgi:hypothetical protein